MPISSENQRILTKHHDIAELLMRDLPYVQAAALKHNHLTSVINVANNPIAWSRPKDEDPDHLIKIIGFADYTRTHPIELVCETDPSSNRYDAQGNVLPPKIISIRHAFAPNKKDSLDVKLMHALVRHDDAFADKYGLDRRHLLLEFDTLDRNQLAAKGFNSFPGEDFFDEKFESYITNFYATTPLDIRNQIPSRKSVNIKDPNHKRILENNLVYDVNNMAYQHGYEAEEVINIKLDTVKAKLTQGKEQNLELNNISFSNTTTHGNRPQASGNTPLHKKVYNPKAATPIPKKQIVNVDEDEVVKDNDVQDFDF